MNNRCEHCGELIDFCICTMAFLHQRIATLQARLDAAEAAMEDWRQVARMNRENAEDALARLDAVAKALPKLQTMARMPNTEWVADEHNAAIKTIKAALEKTDDDL